MRSVDKNAIMRIEVRMKLTTFSRMALFCSAVVFTSCGGNKDDPPEEINKLRALGVSSSKLTTIPSATLPLESITLTVHAAAPKGTKISVNTFVDKAAANAFPIETTLVPASESYDTQYESIDLFTANIAFAVPPATVLKFRPGARFISLRYGIELVAGSETEKIVGSIPIYEPGSPEIDGWKPLNIGISKPLVGATFGDDSEQEIEANLEKATDENVRVSWFVTGGLVKNRRAKTTKWQTPSKTGKHVIIATARGLRTGSFDIKPVEVNVD